MKIVNLKKQLLPIVILQLFTPGISMAAPQSNISFQLTSLFISNDALLKCLFLTGAINKSILLLLVIKQRSNRNILIMELFVNKSVIFNKIFKNLYFVLLFLF